MNTIEGRAGIDYLNSRKLSINEIKRFNIGLAGDNDILSITNLNKTDLVLRFDLQVDNEGNILDYLSKFYFVYFLLI